MLMTTAEIKTGQCCLYGTLTLFARYQILIWFSRKDNHAEKATISENVSKVFENILRIDNENEVFSSSSIVSFNCCYSCYYNIMCELTNLMQLLERSIC